MRLSLFYLFLLSTTLCGQDYFSISINVVDENEIPLSSVTVSIKEIGYQSEVTDSKGNVYFENVPEGEINYFATLNEYKGVKGTFNITSEVKSNTLKIKLTQIPKGQSMVLISGEVLDKYGKEISNAKIELRAGKNIQVAESDLSGNFNIEFDISKIQYNIPEFTLEAKKESCKEKLTFLIPNINYIYKEITLDCNNQNKGIDQSKDIVKDSAIITKSSEFTKVRGTHTHEIDVKAGEYMVVQAIPIGSDLNLRLQILNPAGEKIYEEDKYSKGSASIKYKSGKLGANGKYKVLILNWYIRNGHSRGTGVGVYDIEIKTMK